MENEENDCFEFIIFIFLLNVKSLQSNKQVFLIDHALTFRYGDLPKLLQSHLQLTDRLSNMLKYWQTKKKNCHRPPIYMRIQNPTLFNKNLMI